MSAMRFKVPRNAGGDEIPPNIDRIAEQRKESHWGWKELQEHRKLYQEQRRLPLNLRERAQGYRP